MRLRRVLPAAALLSAAVMLGGCSAVSQVFGGDQAVRDAESGEVTDAGQADVFTLAVGDCLDDQSATEVTDVPVVPCDQAHDYEVFYDFSIDGEEWPGEEAVNSAADEGCYNAFADFVGLSYEESTLDYGNYVPTQESWEEGGDRIVSCMITDPAGKVTGSLAGVAR